MEVDRQRDEDDRTGGGMVCPKCLVRGLVMLDEERMRGAPTRMQCGNPKCLAGVAMKVTKDGITLTEVSAWGGK